jgi:uncharacterized protein (TIRG00374 family)
MKRKFPTFNQIVFFLLAIAFAYALYTYQGQITETAKVLQRGVWYIILATLFVLAGYIYNQAVLYGSLYELFDLPPQKRPLLLLYLVTRFVMVAAPSGGLSGWVPFIQDARRRDLGVGKVLIANLVYMILWYSSFSVFLLAGLLSLFLAHDLQWFEISAAIILIVVDLVMIAIVVLAGVAPQLLHTIFKKVQQVMETIAGWFKRPAPLKAQQIDRVLYDLQAAVTHTRELGKRSLLKPLGHALLNETLNLAILYLLARSFGIHLTFGILVAAYSISILFYIISPTPGGLGFVEGSMVLVLTSLGVLKARATVLTIAYRGITFWLPFMLGFVALRWTARQPASN